MTRQHSFRCIDPVPLRFLRIHAQRIATGGWRSKATAPMERMRLISEESRSSVPEI